jgi:hypothetical protein
MMNIRIATLAHNVYRLSALIRKVGSAFEEGEKLSSRFLPLAPLEALELRWLVTLIAAEDEEAWTNVFRCWLRALRLLVTLCVDEAEVLTAMSSSLHEDAFKADALGVSEAVRNEIVEAFLWRVRLGAISRYLIKTRQCEITFDTSNHESTQRPRRFRFCPYFSIFFDDTASGVEK